MAKKIWYGRLHDPVCTHSSLPSKIPGDILWKSYYTGKTPPGNGAASKLSRLSAEWKGKRVSGVLHCNRSEARLSACAKNSRLRRRGFRRAGSQYDKISIHLVHNHYTAFVFSAISFSHCNSSRSSGHSGLLNWSTSNGYIIETCWRDLARDSWTYGDVGEAGSLQGFSISHSIQLKLRPRHLKSVIAYGKVTGNWVTVAYLFERSL